jgi:hypothetical protein
MSIINYFKKQENTIVIIAGIILITSLVYLAQMHPEDKGIFIFSIIMLTLGVILFSINLFFQLKRSSLHKKLTK